jgi:hypothetical protein
VTCGGAFDVLIAAQQALNREKLDFWMIVAVPEVRFLTARVNRIAAHWLRRFFQRDEKACRYFSTFAKKSLIN